MALTISARAFFSKMRRVFLSRWKGFPWGFTARTGACPLERQAPDRDYALAQLPLWGGRGGWIGVTTWGPAFWGGSRGQCCTGPADSVIGMCWGHHYSTRRCLRVLATCHPYPPAGWYASGPLTPLGSALILLPVSGEDSSSSSDAPVLEAYSRTEFEHFPS